MEVTNKFKGLDVVDRQSAWRIMDGDSLHCTGGRNQDHLQEKQMKKGKTVVWQGLTNSWKRKEAKGKGKGKINSFECRVSKNKKEM